jgi:hypothetical protein
MRLINPNDMVRALQHGRVRTGECALYTILFVVGWILLALTFFPRFPALYTVYANSRLQIAEMVFLFLLQIVELFLAYYLNRSGDALIFGGGMYR